MNGLFFQNDARQMVKYAKEWLRNSLVIIGNHTALSLASIEDAYKVHCDKTGQERIITTPTLARLVHSMFRVGGVSKCRLGSRGKQTIHYKNLSLGTTVGVEQNRPARSEQEQIFTLDEPIDLSTHGRRAPPSSHGCVQVPPRVSSSTDDISNQPDCAEGYKKLYAILTWNIQNGHKKFMLKQFAHSASCKATRCSKLCMMFKRVRRHLIAAAAAGGGGHHECPSILRLYTIVLKLHVLTCQEEDSKCGLPSCSILKNKK